MIAFKSLAFFTLICFYFKASLSTYTLSGNDLYDLQETTTTNFGTGWTLTQYVTAGVKSSFCGDTILLGGYDILGGVHQNFTVQYTGLPSHNVINYTLVFWAIDSWDPGESDAADLQFDSIHLSGWTYPQNPSGASNICGESNFAEISGIILEGQVAHNSSTLNFTVISKMSQTTTDESFGFRELHLQFGTVTTTITNSMCAITPVQMPTTQPATSTATAPVNTCSCLSSEYEYPTRTGHCYPCNADCLTCNNSGPASCMSCVDGEYLSSTQCNPCYMTCATCSGADSYSCTSCYTGSYLVLNKACVTSCDPPLITVLGTSGSPDKCNSPCPSTSDFIYWDGSCDSTCPNILQQENIAGLKLCEYPCLTTEYLYWDGTCQSSCDSPLITTVNKSRNFCTFPCSTSEYLWWDNTCHSTCPSYFVSSTLDGMRTCNLRCPIGQFYTDWDGSCVSSCDSPYRAGQYTCDTPCEDSQDYFYPDTDTCSSECSAPYRIETSGLYSTCVYPELSGFLANLFLLAPEEEGTPTVVALIKVMQYVRYLDITMPPRLGRLALSKGRNIASLNFGFNMPTGMKDEFAMNSVDTIFAKHDLHSQFFVNFWKDFIWIVFIFFAAVLFRALELLCSRSDWKFWQSIFAACRAITLWNFIIVTFAYSIDDIILYSSIELSTFYQSMDSALAYFSFFSCIIVLLLTLALVIFTLYLLIRRAPTINRDDLNFPHKAAAFTAQHRACGVLYLGFNSESIFSRFFFLIYMARIALPMLVAMVAMNSPTINVFLQNVISIAIIFCILKFKPLHNHFNHFQLVLYELGVLMMNSVMFVITVLEVYGIDSLNITIVLGDIVIAANSVTNMLLILFAAVKIVIEIGSISKLIGTKSFHQQISFLIQLLVIVMQQCNMGFESVFGVYALYSAPTELGVDADMIQKLHSPTKSNGETIRRELPRLANRHVFPHPLPRELDIDLKSRLSKASNIHGNFENSSLELVNQASIGTNISRIDTPYQQGRSTPSRELNILGLENINNSREVSRGSILNSSFIPLTGSRRENNLTNNTLPDDFGDLMIYGDTLTIPTTGKGPRHSTSIDLTPTAFQPLQALGRNYEDSNMSTQLDSKRRKK